MKKQECEIKYRINDENELKSILDSLERNKFIFVERRIEKDFVPDLECFPCRNSKILLRFRQISFENKKDVLVTLKEKGFRGVYKMDTETEFLLSQEDKKEEFEKINSILKNNIGVILPDSVINQVDLFEIQKILIKEGWTEIRAFNEKIRKFFKLKNVNIFIDEFPKPIGMFCEIEAWNERNLLGIIKKINLPESRIVREDYGEIILKETGLRTLLF